MMPDISLVVVAVGSPWVAGRTNGADQCMSSASECATNTEPFQS